MIVEIDATKLKYPNTGLYHFTLELAHAIYRHAGLYGVEPLFLVNKKNDLPPHFKTRKVGALDKIFPRHNPKTEVYHSLFQLNKNKPPRKAKRLYTVHDLNFLYEKSTTKQRKYLAKLKKETLRADHIACISRFSKSELLKHIPTITTPVDVIYNGCNISTITPQKPRCAPDAEFLFSLGVMLPKKNWHTLPPLLVNNDLHLVLAGKQSPYVEQIIQAARQYNVEKRVHIVGTISEAEKKWYFQNCKAFVFPSTAEGFGLPVIEAMFYAKPLFLSPLCSLPEIAGNLAYYFDQEFTPHKMQATLENGLNDFRQNANHDQLIAKAKSFNWDNAAHQYLKIYTQLATFQP